MSPLQKSGIPDPRGNKLYDFEETTVYAYAGDPRFSYCLYVPPDLLGAPGAGRGGAGDSAAGPHPLGGPGAPPELLVMVHGTGRAFTRYRDALSEFGRWNRCIVLCPLFPVGVMGDGNRDGFKHLREGDIRYDLVLLGMVDEVAARSMGEGRFAARLPGEDGVVLAKVPALTDALTASLVTALRADYGAS